MEVLKTKIYFQIREDYCIKVNWKLTLEIASDVQSTMILNAGK